MNLIDGNSTASSATDNAPGQAQSFGRGVVITAVLITVSITLILIELLSSQLLLIRYRHSGVLDDGALSSLVLLRKAATRLGWIEEPNLLDMLCVPSPCTTQDPTFGWADIPGEFSVLIKRRKRADLNWETLQVKTTTNPDQSRWTGLPADPQKPTIYIFGDSFVHGAGVNDEQTFAYHLQMARPQYNVKLFATGGYGLVQSYLRMAQLKPRITERDIVIIGYADFYDARNVAAPSRLRDIENWFKKRRLPNDGSKIPVASIGSNNELSIDIVSQDCEVRRSYCRSADPSASELEAVSLRLIHEIAGATKAKTYLLHIDGVKDNPVVQNCGIEVISALQDDFPYVIRDDNMGFDPHPGPYWHYAIAQKLMSTIQ